MELLVLNNSTWNHINITYRLYKWLILNGINCVKTDIVSYDLLPNATALKLSDKESL